MVPLRPRACLHALLLALSGATFPVPAVWAALPPVAASAPSPPVAASAPSPPVAAASAPSPPAAANLHAGFIHTQGRRFVDGSGHDFVLHGIGLGNWLLPEGYMFHFTRARAPHEIRAVIEALLGPHDAGLFWTQFRAATITQADIRFIAAAGFTAVRVPFDWKLFARRNAAADRLDGPGYALLDQLLDWCRAAGLRVILDMHAAAGGQTGVNHDDGPGYGLLFYVPRDQDLTVALWHQLAARYADNPTVLGYDLLNEPISPYMDEARLDPELEPLYRRIAAAIRAVDRNHVLFLQGAQWASNFTMFGYPFDANMALSYHMFWAHPTRAAIAPMLDAAIADNIPLWLGESGEFTDSWNAKFVRLQEQNGIAWSFWTYKTLDSTSTVLSIPKIAGWDALTALGDKDQADWPEITPKLRAQARTALAAYLTALQATNTIVNGCYLASLGLHDPQSPGPGCTAHPFRDGGVGSLTPTGSRGSASGLARQPDR